MSTSYELFLHYKQGDDFGTCIEGNKNVSEALRVWAESFKHNAAICEQLAKAFEGQELVPHADTHHISFVPQDDQAVHCLKTMVAEELLTAYDHEDEDAYDAGDADDSDTDRTDDDDPDE